MGEPVSWLDDIRDILFRYHCIWCFGFFDHVGMQSDLKRFPLADIGRILRQEEGQLRELEGKGEVRLDDRLPVVAPVVLSEKTGRYVDRDDMSVRFIDIVDNGGESTCQRTVQPRAEKSVDHDVVFRQYGWREILDHLREFNPVHKKQAAFVGLAVG